MTAPAQEYFKNRQEAHTWLDENGYKVSRGKFYGDCKKGFPAVQKDGTVSKYQTALYGKGLADDIIPDASALETSEFRHQKEEAEARIAVMKAERMEKEESRDWISRIESYATMAAIIGMLRDAQQQDFSLYIAELIHRLGGDPARAGEGVEFLVEMQSKSFNTVAGKNAVITFEKETK